VAEYTASLYVYGKSFQIEEIGEFISLIIVVKAAAAQTYEVCWLLFLAREPKIQINANALQTVTQLRSGAVAFLT